MTSMDLPNQIAMVAGAGRGIGGALSLDLAGLGADMVLTCRGSRTRCEELADQMREMGRRVRVLQGGISHSEDCSRMTEEAMEFYGRPVQILVNNVGYLYDVAPLAEMSDDQVNNTTDISSKGTMYMSREACRRLTGAGTPGRAINITSGVVHSGRVSFSNYYASKAGMLGLTRVMTLELASTHINVSSASMGYMEVGHWEGDLGKDAARVNIILRIFLRRPSVPGDIPRTVRLLASERGDWVTRSDFIIDGGESCGRVPLAD